jgi:hypothetical protein
MQCNCYLRQLLFYLLLFKTVFVGKDHVELQILELLPFEVFFFLLTDKLVLQIPQLLM